MTDSTIFNELAQIPILEELSQEELKVVAPYWRYLDLPPSEILFSEGDPADALYYVLEGELIIYKGNNSAIPFEISRVVANQFFGEQAVLDNTVRSGTLQAATTTRLLVLKKDDFYEIIEKHQHIGVILLKGLARYLSLQLRKTTGQFIAIHQAL
ncbi:MAG: cyclic nucleotide-binding domain-containing protein [Puniceicoccales bacterium]|jgi:CRP-like cAMP-binding protein|nr:cyclic nucleotide-binding domain-containing protein [Puniceicoccales bacterium]